MNKAKTTLRMYETGALAIVRVETIERGLEIAEGCLEGGIDVLEISYTLNNAGDVIEAIDKKFNDKICVGAGTVLDSETARHAILKGAKFIIAPNYDEGVAKICNRYQIPYAPGCTTLSEAVDALSVGAAFIKAFPISDFYGPKLCKVFKTPLPNMPILASGGITLDNLNEWLMQGVDVCGFGGLLTTGSKEEIAKNAKSIRQIILGFRK
ncbi:ketohydroxyglutarate aldolase [Anaerorhabdus furcosa]|uniref:2-dehydro-3-deoxyphosphogluconate aldolase / (4S)-4-hydroxy-2-oxoglutarate aldolase n=1 Tax=Anaerorhabdus furcosa TaxID=118967 RepID=A0A1T4MMJ1_9FIRM|nr:ketohydroxyglutarate aldolase [Anaerorhabdus furcosa]SJZ67928.1 2-dehydro-3-deoxyphosphogluconate aldolase / (4S)-4-hydroxy-2-oxoglutarate aldolase [Anaerorhabdus furcosa]